MGIERMILKVIIKDGSIVKSIYLFIDVIGYKWREVSIDLLVDDDLKVSSLSLMKVGGLMFKYVY